MIRVVDTPFGRALRQTLGAKADPQPLATRSTSARLLGTITYGPGEARRAYYASEQDLLETESWQPALVDDLAQLQRAPVFFCSRSEIVADARAAVFRAVRSVTDVVDVPLERGNLTELAEALAVAARYAAPADPPVATAADTDGQWFAALLAERAGIPRHVCDAVAAAYSPASLSTTSEALWRMKVPSLTEAHVAALRRFLGPLPGE